MATLRDSGHYPKSKVKVTRGNWIYLFIVSIIIEWPVISTVFQLESPNLKYKYMRLPGFVFWAWDFTQGQRSMSGRVHNFQYLKTSEVVNI